MNVVQLLPDGHRIKKEVDAALDTVSETMTPMHYHLRELIICTYRQVSPSCPAAFQVCSAQAAVGPLVALGYLLPPGGGGDP